MYENEISFRGLQTLSGELGMTDSLARKQKKAPAY
jgi:hypothetical protein